MNNYDLSVCIPARNEEFLALTVDNILKNKRGKTEVIVHLDGYWPDPALPDHPDLTLIHSPQAIGQRAGTNQAVRASRAKYIMKLDAHCAVDEGFDTKMLADMQDNYTMIPTLYNLHMFDLVCVTCGDRQYQAPIERYLTCNKCGGERKREIVFKPRLSRMSTHYRFDTTLHFQYWNDLRHREGFEGDITETFSAQGSCFLVTRAKYWELNLGDEDHGSWGGQGTQVACATWLSGGRLVTTRKTWYSHMFRTQGGSFGFPYSLSGGDQERAREYSRDLWLNNKHPKQIYPLSWLLQKFWPIPGWSDEDLLLVKDRSLNFTPVIRGEALLSVTNPTDTMSFDTGGRKGMSALTEDFSGINSSKAIATENILGVQNESQVQGVTTPNIVTGMVKDGDILSNPSSSVAGNRSNEPSIDKTMSGISNPMNSNGSISPRISSSNPIPATTNAVNSNLGKERNESVGTNIGNDKHIIHQLSTNIIYYTDCQLRLKYAHAVQNQLRRAGLPIISSSLKPMAHFGTNVYVPLPRGKEAYFTQIIRALEKSEADIVYMCEHDVLYHPSHFQFIPPRMDTFYYNHNFWRIRPETDNFAVHWDANQVSGLVASRRLLLDWYRRRWREIQQIGFDRKYEPENTQDPTKTVAFKSDYPNIDIRHSGTLTLSKWKLADFRNKATAVNWQESTMQQIPGWDLSFLL